MTRKTKTARPEFRSLAAPHRDGAHGQLWRSTWPRCSSYSAGLVRDRIGIEKTRAVILQAIEELETEGLVAHWRPPAAFAACGSPQTVVPKTVRPI